MRIVDVMMILILIDHSFGQVTLHLDNEEACAGDDLTFSCEAIGFGILVWRITALPGVAEFSNVFGQSLNAAFVRVTSTDTTLGPNPSSITIINVTAADNGATLQCRIVNMEMSNVITLSIRPPECSIALQATAVTDTSITVMLMWTNCEGAEPSTVSLSWFPEQNSCNVRYIGSLPANYEITNLVPSTNYTIMANFTDCCGSASALVVAATLPSKSMDSHIVPVPTRVAQVPLIGAACIPTISVLTTILVILLILVLILTVALLLLCCKIRTLNTARTSSPETDTVKTTSVSIPSLYTDVEMTHSPAYGPIATLKGDTQYEEVAS